jgi:ClpA/ClpB-like protein
MSELPDLNQLIALVDSGAADDSDDALTRLPGAVAMSEQLGELGDHLVGHFVDEARHQGASWTAIGASMGVSKQAAQKRFVPSPGDIPAGRLFSRFTPRASKVLEVAQKEARRMKNGGVGTEHVVLGLVATGGVAAEVIDAQGVSPSEVRKAVRAAAAPAADDAPDRVPFAPATQRVLEVAVREALRRGHNYIGTEHLLLAVLADTDSVGSRVLTSLGIHPEETSQRIDQLLAELTAAHGF